MCQTGVAHLAEGWRLRGLERAKGAESALRIAIHGRRLVQTDELEIELDEYRLAKLTPHDHELTGMHHRVRTNQREHVADRRKMLTHPLRTG